MAGRAVIPAAQPLPPPQRVLNLLRLIDADGDAGGARGNDFAVAVSGQALSFFQSLGDSAFNVVSVFGGTCACACVVILYGGHAGGGRCAGTWLRCCGNGRFAQVPARENPPC